MLSSEPSALRMERAQISKTRAETMKMRAETRKLLRETYFVPIVVLGSIVCAAIAGFTAVGLALINHSGH